VKRPGILRFSIRQRIAFWYMAIFMITCAFITLLSFNGARKILEKVGRDNAARIVFIVAGKVDAEQGRVILNFANRDEESLFRGIQYALYSPDDALLDGGLEGWMRAYPKELGTERQIHGDWEESWLLFDKALARDKLQAGWLRVAVPSTQTAEDDDIDELENLWFVVLLLSLALMVLGGFFVPGRALKPLKAIAGAAREIGSGDMTKRLILLGKKDEVGELEEAFNEMADNLAEAFAREKQFTSDVSHELRTPLAVITANAENAEQSGNIGAYKQANALILQKSRQLQRMISQLLIFARERDQAETMLIEEVDLHRILADIADEASDWALEKSIAIEKEMPEDLLIQADQMLLTRLFLNLLDNAVKYGRRGGWVKIKAEKNKRRVIVSVSDNGEGIAEADLPHIFKRFYRADKSRSSEGAGLGLAFVEMIVRLHHGTITARSVQGVETSFVVELPLEQARP
jgi:signal transduction histidine kinase